MTITTYFSQGPASTTVWGQSVEVLWVECGSIKADAVPDPAASNAQLPPFPKPPVVDRWIIANHVKVATHTFGEILYLTFAHPRTGAAESFFVTIGHTPGALPGITLNCYYEVNDATGATRIRCGP